MDKPDNYDIVIKAVIYGFLIGILFPVLSLVINSLTGSITFTAYGSIQLHKLYPAQYLLDLMPLLTTLTGFLIGNSLASQKNRMNTVSELTAQKNERMLAFTEKLIQGELDVELSPEFPGDSLSGALVNLRDNLKKNNREQLARKKEDDQRNWVSEGLARFGEILRRPSENMEEFSFNIISNLVKYLKANQGGFFLVETGDDLVRYFDLKASYAFDRKKFSDKIIDWGEGLIGTCAIEKQSIYMTDIPDSYLSVTSGLGKANPKNLLIVPVIVQDEVLAIIELATFAEFQDFEIHFVESVAESIAITIASVRSNIRTSVLLSESQKQAEALAMQEEKMRQNMTELREIQEQAAKQAEKFISFTNSVNHTLIRSEYSADGTLIYANTKFLHKLGYFGNSEVEGKHISSFIDEKDMDWFNEIWNRLSEGGKHYQGYMKHVSKTGQDVWVMATYTCVRKDDGSVDRILFLAIDNTEQKKQSLDYQSQMEAINRLNLKCEFAPDGKFINCNPLFLETLKFTHNELETMTVFDFIDKKEIESFTEIWEKIISGIPYQGQMKSLTKYEDEKWFRSAYTAVPDMYGEISKVIFLASEITNEKIMEMESQRSTDQLKIHEEKLKLATVELKKKLEITRTELEQQYKAVLKDQMLMRSTLNDLSDIVFSFDNQGKIRFINQAAESFWGIRNKEASGKNLKSLNIAGLLQTGEEITTGVSQKVRIPDKTGSPVDCEMLVAMADSDEGKYYTAFIRLR